MFENLWSEDGEEIVAAPGGSGAFRDLMKHLLGETEELAARETAGVEVGAGASSSDDAVAAASASEGDGRSAPPVGPARPSAPMAGRVPVPGERVDPAVLARAVAAVAPSLPEEHRGSLARVFRAFADALEER